MGARRQRQLWHVELGSGFAQLFSHISIRDPCNCNNFCTSYKVIRHVSFCAVVRTFCDPSSFVYLKYYCLDSSGNLCIAGGVICHSNYSEFVDKNFNNYNYSQEMNSSNHVRTFIVIQVLNVEYSWTPPWSSMVTLTSCFKFPSALQFSRRQHV